MEFETKPWMQNITAEDMPNDDLKFIAEVAGLKSALALILHTPGLIVSIPKNAFRQLRDKHIQNNYNGTKYSMDKLAIECDVTPRQIYNIIKQRKI